VCAKCTVRVRVLETRLQSQPASFQHELRNYSPSCQENFASPPLRGGDGRLAFLFFGARRARTTDEPDSTASTAMADDAQCRHCPTEQLVDLVLSYGFKYEWWLLFCSIQWRAQAREQLSARDWLTAPCARYRCRA
jgi:hypothetical protein